MKFLWDKVVNLLYTFCKLLFNSVDNVTEFCFWAIAWPICVSFLEDYLTDLGFLLADYVINVAFGS